MFEVLTKYIEPIETGEFRVGTDDDGYIFYDGIAEEFMDAVYEFAAENPYFDMEMYGEILEDAGIEITSKAFAAVDIETQTAKTVLAILIASARAERLCEGAWGMVYESGTLLRVLRRLKELDD